MRHPFVRVRPRSEQIYVSHGRVLWMSDASGIIGAQQTGLFVHETRMLSRHCVTLNGKSPVPVALSKVEQHTWLGYYVFAQPYLEDGNALVPHDMMEALSEYPVELRISRFVGANIHEDLDLANFSQKPVQFELQVALDADFVDLVEIGQSHHHNGQVERIWSPMDDERCELLFNYTASHNAQQLHRALAIHVHRAGSRPRWSDGQLCFEIELEPHQRWHCCIEYNPRLEPELELNGEETRYRCHSFDATSTAVDSRHQRFLDRAARLKIPGERTLSHIVAAAFGQAVEDLASLRLPDLDVNERSWTMAAGLPLYVALFGRDTLTASWQASILDTGMVRGTLARLAELQGQKVDDWRDERPGRMLHEAHTGPLESLNYNPRGRYYGSITTSAFYPVALCELWHWTGDKDLVRPFVQPALDALAWLDRDALSEDGFYQYQTRSEQGTRHQAWKDSDSAMVYEDGRVAEPPIATCEEQGFVFMAKFMMSELLWWLGDLAGSRRLYHEASELKKRFIDRFWMHDEAYLAMALDSEGRPLRSIASNAGHCLATGIIDASMAGPIAGRMIAEDLFSGWGIRTLSSNHPAYNPYSYHRGSVWPVENATFALGFWRYGLREHANLIARAQFEAAALFDLYRLPEVFSGHGNDDDHPFPAFYPRANWPQAWSASAIFCYIQAMCGIYPYAPLKMLLVDPHLPEWLPELLLENVKVGQASVDLYFRRQRDGKTTYRIKELHGTLHVLRQPSPWSLTASTSQRVSQALASLLPGY